MTLPQIASARSALDCGTSRETRSVQLGLSASRSADHKTARPETDTPDNCTMAEAHPPSSDDETLVCQIREAHRLEGSTALEGCLSH